MYKEYLIKTDQYHDLKPGKILFEYKNKLSEAISLAKTNYLGKINKEKDESLPLNNDSNLHVFAKVLIGSESDLEKGYRIFNNVLSII
ncbi:MAG: hypothetical protein R2759_13370 [Bacteroidales bacterium]